MTSSLRTFAKSLHWLAAGWAIGVVWLCVAQIQHGLLFDPVIDYHVSTLIEGGVPTFVVEALAFLCVGLVGVAPTRELEWREWRHAFLWALFPNMMVLYAVHLMVAGDL